MGKEVSMFRPKWEIAGFERQVAVGFCRRGINPLNAVVLASRGITDSEGIAALMDTADLPLYDPYLLPDMDKAVARLRRAIADGETVAVYGDYDVDGITATTLMTLWLRSKGLECHTYIPERFDEGYGVNRTGLDTLHELGATLVITVDCGITAAEETLYAKSLGMDVLITDHHECGETIPEAVAVVDPKRCTSKYPNQSLAGVGVAFKTVCAADRRTPEQLLSLYGDLVMMGTVADVMEVVGENRRFLRRGLQVLARNPRPGLASLCDAAGAKMPVNASTVGFTLSPRINAAGRMGRAQTALELMLTEEPSRAAALARELNDMNAARQAQEAEVFTQAQQMVPSAPLQEAPIVLASEEWSQGVAGIVASRLAEKFGVPAIIISVKDGVGKGSCRSVFGFNVYEALDACQGLLLGFGGHSMAAGLTIAQDKIEEFTSAISAHYAAVRPTLPDPCLKIDLEVEKPELLSVENVRDLEKLEPFGTGFPSPALCFTGVSVDAVLPISGGRHTKFWIKKKAMVFECVAFNRSAQQLGVTKGAEVDVAFIPRINEFRGRRSVQLSVIDVRKQ